MEYFKEISNYLSRKYPDRKVYVISDQHFNHKNIIKFTRNDLFESVEAMDEYMISKHNEMIENEDIVLMLGDFSFKKNPEYLTELVSKIKGHKFLVLGNHDEIDKPNLYLKAGFEDVFLSPVKWNGDYYSHYPLNASVDSNERPDTILYKHLCEEFKTSSTGINYHGHQHILKKNGEREKNVCAELVDYKPILIGRTKPYLSDSKNNDPYLEEEFLDIMHRVMKKYSNIQENKLIIDYLYTIILELFTKYQDQIMAFGSFMLNKKYHSSFIPSDLDIVRLYDSSQSKGANRLNFKEFGKQIFEQMNQVERINVDFYKKIDFICILSFLYVTKNQRVKGYVDMHIILDEFYQSEDFIKESGISLLEEYANKMRIESPQTIKYPKYRVLTTSALADVTNYFLQYIYSMDEGKKNLALKKIHLIIDHLDPSTQIDFEKLQNTLIRYLLRNIYFYERCNRKKEAEYALTKKKIHVPSYSGMRGVMLNNLKIMTQKKEYERILNSIYNSNNRMKEISRILTYYK